MGLIHSFKMKHSFPNSLISFCYSLGTSLFLYCIVLFLFCTKIYILSYFFLFSLTSSKTNIYLFFSDIHSYSFIHSVCLSACLHSASVYSSLSPCLPLFFLSVSPFIHSVFIYPFVHPSTQPYNKYLLSTNYRSDILLISFP